MIITYDKEVDAAYIYLVPSIEHGGIKKTYLCDPLKVNGQINLDFNEEGKLIGLEVLDASRLLSPDLLKNAIKPSDVRKEKP